MMSAHDVEIITYGGGDLLRMVFNAIAMLFYGNDQNSSFVRPLCVISASIGSIWAISKCFFQSYIDAFLTKYFLPLMAIPSLLLIPQARVHIIDKIENKPIVVDHVPLIFAKITALTSFWGNSMTEAIENVMHTPNDVKYSKTGMLFGADTSLDFSRLRLTDANLSQNLHQFTQQCIIYDIALNRYTMDDLQKSSNLLCFLAENTSKVRMIPYVEENRTEFLSCIETVKKMEPLFDKEVAYFTKHEILKNVPISYQVLLNFKKHSEKQLSEQLANASNPDSICKNIIAVNAINDATSRFAVERAKNNQRNIYQTGGALAGTSLVTLRIVIEALVYASCIFILPLSILPGGIKFIGNWIFLNIWIQLWPPLYGILNYITMICAQKYAASILGGISNGYSIFTSAGFQDLTLDAAALGGYLSLSVPVLSFYMLQNLQSVAHLSGSLLSPVHSAATNSAGELSTGNYSFANTSIGQVSYDNQSAFQQNTSPTLSSGFFVDNHGTHQVTYGSNHVTANQNPSNLNTTISTAEAYTHQLQSAQQHAQTQVDSSQKLYTDSLGTAQRSIADLVQHTSSAQAYSNGYNTSESLAIQESANFITNATESWGHQHGLSSRESLEYFSSMGLGWNLGVMTSGGHNENVSAVSEEGRQSAENLFNSKDFQEHYQRVINSAHNESINTMSDDGQRYSENYATSMENLKSAQSQHSSALSNLNQISENLSYVESHSSSMNTNLNTEFANWLDKKGELSALTDINKSQELQGFMHDFIEEKCHAEFGTLSNFTEPGTLMTLPDLQNEWGMQQETARQKASELGLNFGTTEDFGQGTLSQFEATESKISHKLDLQHQQLNSTQDKLSHEFKTEHQRLGINRLNSRLADNISSVGNKIQSSVEPSSWDWFADYSDPK